MLEDKAAMRSDAKRRRAEAHEQLGSASAAMLAQFGLEFIGSRPEMSVSGFSAIRDEISPLKLLKVLHGQGHVLALPAMQGKGLPLVFRKWAPGDAMSPAVWGIAEPLPTAEVVEPDVVLVPLLAFDARGYRLGYGGGFYDRTIARLRAMKPVVAVGIAYDEQEVDAVPHADYDERLDWVLTPSGARRCLG